MGSSFSRFWESEFLSDFKSVFCRFEIKQRDLLARLWSSSSNWKSDFLSDLQRWGSAVQCCKGSSPSLFPSLLQIFSTWHCHKFQNNIVRAFGIMISLLQMFSTRHCHKFKIIFRAFGIMISPLLQIVSTQHSYQGSRRSQKWFARLLSFPVAFKTKSEWKWQHQVEAR